MAFTLKRHVPWALVWLVVSLIGAWVMASLELVRLRETFDAETSIALRLLSQKMAQNDAALTLLAQFRTQDGRPRPEQRLTQTYPQILSIQKRESDASWQDEALRLAETESLRLQHSTLADVNFTKGRYQLVLGAEPASYALMIDLRALIPWREWPMLVDTSPVRMALSHALQVFSLQPGNAIAGDARGWHIRFSQPLQSESQPFKLEAQRQVGWDELPWSPIAAFSLAVALLLLAVRALLRQRHDRLRAHELLHLGQVGRLNTLTELATGVVHGLDEPMSRVLAASQATEDLLRSEPLDLNGAQVLAKLTLEETKRATGVVNRLRHVVEQPDLSGQLEPVNLHAAARLALDLLASELDRLQVRTSIQVTGSQFSVLAQPDALEQIIHNLLMNSLQALELVPPSGRHVALTLSASGQRGQLTVKDTGPGIANNVVMRIFEPFFTTRQGALGLGLSLCETLAHSMGGTLTAFNRVPQGAEFCLSLPLAH